MTNDPKPMQDAEPAETPAADPAEGDVAGATDARLAALEAENAEMKDRVLRTMAEMENLRRRTERQVADTRQYAIAGFARDMLTAGDNLARALESVPDDVRKNEGVKTFVEGVEMTERDLLNTLERHGVKKLEPLGQKFDPNLHQAIFEVPTDDQPPGTVVQVMQSGYVIGERVLRPAMVGVAKGAPRAREAADAPPASGQSG
ncbi:nucleotide exchange factor GrpE [Kaistia geumhonensis]|uniref:Protein GrpE n=1 Tax=Kaistia geumhonensis TaxID=410839 RepID=A0ABU0M7Q7_9HYPH|nr:nucleotide exchange factor GrpE [Kaistia geumhonensis]MCX5477789.1 nucleotide exchange factor GrpE [Kaistia geumhonensis]MDQ0517000.1 molecular chaperone GrpE [Kaistia geumhonensis]